MSVLANQSPTRPPGRPRRRGGLRLAFAVVLGALTVFLTGLFVWAGVDIMTHEYVEGEVLVARGILGAIGLLTLYAGVGALVLFRSSRGTLQRRPTVVAGLVVTSCCVVAAMVLPPVLSLVAFALAVGAAVAVLLGVTHR